MDKGLLALIIFAATYGAIAIGSIPPFLLDRTGIALLGAVALIGFSVIPLEKAFSFVDIPTILLLYGLMIVSSQFRIGGFYTRVATIIAGSTREPRRLLFLLMLASAGVSALLTNDIVCFAFTPVVVSAASKAGWNPVPFLLGLVFASNIGSAATLIGNPQNILIGQRGGLPFLDYTLGAVFPVIISIVMAYLLLLALYKRGFDMQCVSKEKDMPREDERLPFDQYQTAKGMAVLLGLIACFLLGLPRDICAIIGAAVLMCSRRIPSRNLLGFIDWHLLTLFIALFIITGSVSYFGFPEKALELAGGLGIDVYAPSILIVLTAMLSNIFSNVPAVMLLLNNLSFTNDHLFTLAVASTFAGNFMPVSSIANLIVIEQAAQYGVRIRFKEYVKAGIPVTIATLILLYLWRNIFNI